MGLPHRNRSVFKHAHINKQKVKEEALATEGKPSRDPRIREDDKSAELVRPFDKLRARVTEALARHSRVGGNPEIQALKNVSPHTRG